MVPSLYDVDSWKFLFCSDDEDFWMEGVTANKILTNLLKAMLIFNLYFVDQPYTSHELPPLVSSCTLFHTTCKAMNVCELTLVVLTSPQVKDRNHWMRRMKDAVMSS